MMSIAGSAVSRLCMMMTGAPCSATTRAMSGSRCRPQTSLTMAAPASSAQAATGGFHGIDRDRHAERRSRGQDRLEPRALFLDGDRAHAAIGPGRFRADVDDVGAFGDESPRMLDGRGWIEEPAAVGKRIRRDVENAHDQRPARSGFVKSCASTLPALRRGGTRAGARAGVCTLARRLRPLRWPLCGSLRRAGSCGFARSPRFSQAGAPAGWGARSP